MNSSQSKTSWNTIQQEMLTMVNSNYSIIPILFRKPCGYSFLHLFYQTQPIQDIYTIVEGHLERKIFHQGLSHILIFTDSNFDSKNQLCPNYELEVTMSICDMIKHFSMKPMWNVPTRSVFTLWIID